MALAKNIGMGIFTGITSYMIYDRYKYQKKDHKMIILNEWDFHDEVLKFIYHNYSDKIKSFNYTVDDIYHFNEWRFRKKEKPSQLKTFMPNECDIDIIYKENKIHISFIVVKNSKNDPFKILHSQECGGSYESITTKIELKAENKDILTEFVEDAKEWCDNITKNIKKNNKETMNIYYYKKDYWTLISKSPKRSLSTVYLTKDQKENYIQNINDFFSPDTRDNYLKYGIPYKSVQLVYGPPGTGKTSLIKGIASELDCDLYILPIQKDMLDTNLVDAFTYINDNQEKERIIVIEDIDTLFDTERKEGDTNNGITLQGFLNCLDGFTCVEGTMLFLTANKPEVLDYAMIRSCRIDNKIKLDYADKYQTKTMFEVFLPDQKDKFNEFYDEIRHKEYTTAMLQEFLFYNRKCNNILEHLDKFNDIIEKNDPKKFEILKEVNKNFYS